MYTYIHISTYICIYIHIQILYTNIYNTYKHSHIHINIQIYMCMTTKQNNKPVGSTDHPPVLHLCFPKIWLEPFSQSNSFHLLWSILQKGSEHWYLETPRTKVIKDSKSIEAPINISHAHIPNKGEWHWIEMTAMIKCQSESQSVCCSGCVYVPCFPSSSMVKNAHVHLGYLGVKFRSRATELIHTYTRSQVVYFWIHKCIFEWGQWIPLQWKPLEAFVAFSHCRKANHFVPVVVFHILSHFFDNLLLVIFFCQSWHLASWHLTVDWLYN